MIVPEAALNCNCIQLPRLGTVDRIVPESALKFIALTVDRIVPESALDFIAFNTC